MKRCFEYLHRSITSRSIRQLTHTHDDILKPGGEHQAFQTPGLSADDFAESLTRTQPGSAEDVSAATCNNPTLVAQRMNASAAIVARQNKDYEWINVSGNQVSVLALQVVSALSKTTEKHTTASCIQPISRHCSPTQELHVQLSRRIHIAGYLPSLASNLR